MKEPQGKDVDNLEKVLKQITKSTSHEELESKIDNMSDRAFIEIIMKAMKILTEKKNKIKSEQEAIMYQ